MKTKEDYMWEICCYPADCDTAIPSVKCYMCWLAYQMILGGLY